jgi:hypothetical protein
MRAWGHVMENYTNRGDSWVLYLGKCFVIVIFGCKMFDSQFFKGKFWRCCRTLEYRILVFLTD